MSQVNLISQGVHCYKGVWLRCGDPFIADDEDDASELCCIGFAKLAPAGYATRDMVATEAHGTQVPNEAMRKRTYLRRDLTAAK